MTVFSLLVVTFATCVLVYLCAQNKIPEPFHWIVYAILIIVWIAILLMAAGSDLLHYRLG
jgi:hypothetical protein